MVEKLRQFVALVVVLGLVMGGVVVYVKVTQLSSDAQGVVLGLVVGGALLLVPFALVVLAAFVGLRLWMQWRVTRPQAYNQPPVVVVGGGQLGPPPAYYQGYGPARHDVPMLGGSSERVFEVIGEE